MTTDPWAQRIEDHAVWEALNDLLAASDEAASTVVQDEDGNERQPWNDDWHRHTQRIVEHVRARLAAADPEFVPPHAAAQLQAPANKASNQLRAFANSPADETPLKNARQPIDNLVVHASPLPPLPLTEEAGEVRSAVESVRDVVQQVHDAGTSAVDAVERRLSDLRSAHEEELEASERRRTEAEKTHGEDLQERDKRLQQIRAELDDINTGIADTKATLEHAEQEARTEWEAKAKSLLDEIERLQDEAAVLVSDKAAEVVSGGHMDVALDQRKQANTWRAITVVAAVLAVAAALIALAVGEPTDSLAETIKSLAASAGFVGIAGYAGRQSHNHRHRERTSYKAALELAALEGFLANLEPDQRDRAKATFAEHFFSQPLEEPDHDPREEPITGKQLFGLLEALLKR